MRYAFIIFVVVALLILGAIIFWPGSKPSSPTSVPKKLQDFASSNAEVSFTTIGQINGDDIHREIQIIVNNSTRRINIIQGYQGHVIKTESFSNNQNAYEAFLASIERAGFTNKRRMKDDSQAGVCPLGNVYDYDVNNSEEIDSHLWSSTCGVGTLNGQSSTINTLFQNQITNYADFAADVVL